MNTIEFSANTLRFTDVVPTTAPRDGFVWRSTSTATPWPARCLPCRPQRCSWGGLHILDLHCQDLANPTHPSHYDYTSVYDRIIFRRLATQGMKSTASSATTLPAPPATRWRRSGGCVHVRWGLWCLTGC